MTTIFRPPIIHRITAPRKAQPENAVNLLPLQSAIVVAVAPFYQNDWPLPKAPLKAIKLDTQENFLPLISFLPFNQASWPLAARKGTGTKSEIFVNLLPLNSFMPFNQTSWQNPALARSSAIARAFLPAGGSVGPIPPSSTAKEWIIRARRRNRR